VLPVPEYVPPPGSQLDRQRHQIRYGHRVVGHFENGADQETDEAAATDPRIAVHHDGMRRAALLHEQINDLRDEGDESVGTGGEEAAGPGGELEVHEDASVAFFRDADRDKPFDPVGLHGDADQRDYHAGEGQIASLFPRANRRRRRSRSRRGATRSVPPGVRGSWSRSRPRWWGGGLGSR
jgi:hypothetical protein